MEEIKIILRVISKKFPKACEIVLLKGKKGRTYKEYSDHNWGYQKQEYNLKAKEYIQKEIKEGRNIPAIIVITSNVQKATCAVRKVIIKEIKEEKIKGEKELGVNYEFGDYILVEKEDLIKIIKTTMDNQNRFIGPDSAGNRKMCNFIEDGKQFYKKIHENTKLSQDRIKEELEDIFYGIPRGLI